MNVFYNVSFAYAARHGYQTVGLPVILRGKNNNDKTCRAALLAGNEGIKLEAMLVIVKPPRKHPLPAGFGRNDTLVYALREIEPVAAED
jgi:hypothetical protein